jgi:predicted amidophosphoribosyltransferase
MYCSSCGSAVPPNLTYCNRCGAKVNTKSEGVTRAADLIPESVVFAIIAVFVLGIGVTIGLMAVMKEVVGFDLSLILAITMICFSLIIALEAVLIWLLFKSVRMAKQASAVTQKENTTKELEEGQQRALPEHLTSVTEHTTRAFEPIFHDRK